MSLHPCAATGCPHRTAYTWCSAVHSPQRAEIGHRRHPVAPHEPDPIDTPEGAPMKRYDEGTCAPCQEAGREGRIFRRTWPDGEPKSGWYHLHEKDWIYSPHNAVPAVATTETSPA